MGVRWVVSGCAVMGVRWVVSVCCDGCLVGGEGVL